MRTMKRWITCIVIMSYMYSIAIVRTHDARKEKLINIIYMGIVNIALKTIRTTNSTTTAAPTNAIRSVPHRKK